jgi:hypothetical protein
MSRSLAILGALALTGAAAAPVASGMNVNFLNAGNGTAFVCGHPETRAARLEGRLVGYDDPAVRARTQADLAGLKAQGASWVRSLVFFAPRGRAGALFGLDRPEQAAAAVRDYAADVQRAGIENLVIAFGPQGQASPSCRTSAWGDCFAPATIEESWRLVRTVRSALDGASHPRLWIDLYNEGCPAPVSDASTILRPNQIAFVTALLPRYHAAFPDDRLGISCQGDTGVTARLDALERNFAAAGVRPGFVDVHLYGRAGDVSASAAVAARWARRVGAPVFVGETSVGRPDVARAIVDGFRRGGATPLALIAWPLRRSETTCGADSPELL